eukprot:TRINITY_DN57736_c0_g1_i1.p1 TRINITY_DN57736_c0_g1~~TRINITY_DN57736_c0_g1_i1.p1  ORF type:complete len:649 (-),score=118.95 TRINITY_DN57736_c0_g1_i1:266-2212(-)
MVGKWMDGRSFLVGFASCLVLFGLNALPKFGDAIPEASRASMDGQRKLKGESNSNELNVVAQESALLTERERQKEEANDEDETEEEKEGGTEEEEAHFTTADVQVAYVVLGAVMIDVSLFELVNWDDDDIRLYTWSILSMTISIFVAVLSFGAINEYVMLLSEGMNPWIQVALAYGQSLAYLSLMLFWISVESGMICEPNACQPHQVNLDEEPWTIADARLAEHGRALTATEEASVVASTEKNAKRGLYTDEFGNQIAVMKRKLNLEKRLRRMKCYAGLLAHIAGFAQINAGGHLQHMEIFSSSPVLCFIPVLFTGVLCQVVFSMSKAFRKFHLQAAIAAGRAGRRAKMCEEFVEDAENDVMSLSLSFLAVQALRFGITGVLPNLEGVEVPEVKARWQAVAGLLGCAVVFAGMASTLAIRLVQSSHHHDHKAQARTAECQPPKLQRKKTGSWVAAATVEHEEHSEEEVLVNCMERLGPAVMSAMAMSFAWCFLFATRWICVRSPFVNLESMMGAIQLALILSFVAGTSVFLFDKADDFLKNRPGGDSEAASLAVTTIINSLALLVGFTWEKCFDHGVEAVTAGMEGANARGMKLLLAILVSVFVVRPWRRFILTKVMDMEILKRARIQQIRQKAAGYASLESHTPRGS